MTDIEYNLILKGLEEELEGKKAELCKAYVIENCPYQHGDIVEDHIGRLKIETITVIKDWYSGLPSCFFKGTELKKDNTPKKRQEPNRRVYWKNIIKKIE